VFISNLHIEEMTLRRTNGDAVVAAFTDNQYDLSLYRRRGAD
jgi:hypothetical protein